MFTISWFGNILQLTLSVSNIQVSQPTYCAHPSLSCPYSCHFPVCINSCLLSILPHEIPSNINHTSDPSLLNFRLWIFLYSLASNLKLPITMKYSWNFFKAKIYQVSAIFLCIRPLLFFKKGYTCIHEKQTEILSSWTNEFVSHTWKLCYRSSVQWLSDLGALISSLCHQTSNDLVWTWFVALLINLWQEIVSWPCPTAREQGNIGRLWCLEWT